MSEENKLDATTLDKLDQGDDLLKQLIARYRYYLDCEGCRRTREVIAARLRSYLR
jgi:hypothetical protein